MRKFALIAALAIASSGCGSSGNGKAAGTNAATTIDTSRATTTTISMQAIVQHREQQVRIDTIAIRRMFDYINAAYGTSPAAGRTADASADYNVSFGFASATGWVDPAINTYRRAGFTP